MTMHLDSYTPAVFVDLSDKLNHFSEEGAKHRVLKT
jgi:hypothetical protein